MPHRDGYVVLPDSDGVAALIFDWDGTLVRSGEINFQAIRQAMLTQGAVLDPGWYAPRTSLATRQLLAEWEADHGRLPVRDYSVITDFCREYVIAHAVDLVVIEEVAAIARLGYSAGMRLGIASNASTRTLAAGLAATGLNGLFSVTVTSSDVSAGKPSPEVFLETARRLSVDAEQCLVYEDSDLGIIAATAARMRVVDIRDRFAVPSTLARMLHNACDG